MTARTTDQMAKRSAAEALGTRRRQSQAAAARRNPCQMPEMSEMPANCARGSMVCMAKPPLGGLRLQRRHRRLQAHLQLPLSGGRVLRV